MFVTTDEKSVFFIFLMFSKHNSSRSEVFFKIGVLKNFAIFTGKHFFCVPKSKDLKEL